MRDIKFRAWDTEQKRFMEIVTLEIDFIYQMKKQIAVWRKPYQFENSNAISFRAKVNKTILMQYTGLKDKNGVEIYEGDIVKVGNYVYIVEIDLLKGLFFRCIEHLSLRGVNIYYSEFVKNVQIEVIGNIHQNKELLGE